MQMISKNKVMIAMSGGVDSSVAAGLCVNAGYNCIGATMKLQAPHGSAAFDPSCCSARDIADAQNVADTLGIPYKVYDFSGEFEEKVIQKFVSDYEHGRTPNPCVECNRYLKFSMLFEQMKLLGYDYVATGHYARVEKEGERYLLKKAVDSNKDQSYVLYSLNQAQLSHILFPLGNYSKAEIRSLAEKYRLPTAKKSESQDICFIPDGDYISFIKRYTKKEYPSGDFVDTNGQVIGKHKGMIGYTIGQRKKLGISSARPLYVCSKDIINNRIVLGYEENLYRSSLDASAINLIPFDTIERPMKVKVKTRYRQNDLPAVVEQTGPDRLHIEFDSPAKAVCAGQAVVLYDDDVVIGGGTIL